MRASSRRTRWSLASEWTPAGSPDATRAAARSEPVGTRWGAAGSSRRCGRVVVGGLRRWGGHGGAMGVSRRTGTAPVAHLHRVDQVILEGDSLLGQVLGGLRCTDVGVATLLVCGATTGTEHPLPTIDVINVSNKNLKKTLKNAFLSQK